LDLPLVMTVLFVAAVLGDQANFAIGRYVGPKVFAWESSRWFNKRAFDQAHGFYERYGGITIILARFMPFIRTFAPFVAGVGSMQYTRYISYCIMGAILWVGSITLAGYFLGSNEWIQHNFEKVVLGIVAASLLPVVFQFIKHKLAK
jgi:membrane-associated protein